MPEEVNLSSSNESNNLEQFDLWFQSGLQLFQLGQYDEAIEKFEKADSFAGNKGELYGYWVLSLTNLRRFNDAEEIFKKAQNLIPEIANFYLTWGDIIAARGNPELAVEKYQKASEFDETKTQALLIWGNTYYDQAKYEQAREKYREILLINPDDVNAQYNCGLSSFYLGDYLSAKENFKSAIRLDEQNSNYHLWLADTLSWLMDYKSAVSEYKKALKLEIDNNKFFIYRNLGFAYIKLNKLEEAVKNFEKAEELQTDDGYLYLYWGDALSAQKQSDRAMEKYNKASQFESTKSEALLKWGNIYYDRKDYETALEKYREILLIKPDYPDAHYNIGLCAFNLKDYQSSKTAFENAINLNYENSNYHLGLADALSWLADYESAAVVYEIALEKEKIERNKFLIYRNLGFSLVKLDRPDEAIEYFRKAQDLFDEDGFLHVYWGDALAKKNDTEGAVQKYQKAVLFEESKFDALLKWGNVYYDRRDYVAALKKYQEIIALDPNDIDAHYNIGLASFYSQDYEKAKESFEITIKLNDKVSSYHTWLADTLSWLEDYEKSIGEYEKALEHEVEDANKYFIFRNLGFVLNKSNKPDEAIKYFRKASELDNDDGYLYLYWGEALAAEKQSEKAVEKYRKAADYEATKLNALLSWGNIYFDRKDYNSALEKYREITHLYPKEIDAHYNIGLASFYLRDYEAAKANFEYAIKFNREKNASNRNTKESLYRTWLADTLVNLKDYQNAVSEYEAALEMEPEGKDNYFTYLNLGLAHTGLNNFEIAEENFYKAQQYKDDDAYLYSYWGDLNLNQKKFHDAINQYEKALSMEISDPLTNYYMGQCFFKNGKYAKAHQFWEKSRRKFEELEMDESLEDNPDYCYQFAVLLHYVYGEIKEAQKYYEHSSDKLTDLQKFDRLQLYKEIKENHYYNEENIYHSRVEDEFFAIEKKLKNDLIQLEKLKNQKAALESNKPRSQKLNGKIKIEIERIENEILRSDEPYLNYNLGYFYFQKGDFEEAAQYFETAYKLKNSPANTDNSKITQFSKIEIQNSLGICHSRLGNHKKAISFIEKVKKEYPQDYEIQNNLASAYFQAYFDAENDISKARYLDLAENEYKKILLTAPNNLDAVVGLGYLKIEQSEFRKQNLYEEAVEHFEKALQLSLSKRCSSRLTKKLKLFILYHLGYAHIKMYENSNKLLNEKLIVKAADYFQKVVELDRYNIPAKRACEFLKKQRNPLNPETILENFAPFIISFLALAVFILGLTSFFWKLPLEDSNFTAGYFIALSFGSLLFLIAGISLPQLLKLKVGNIELEREIKKSAPINEDFSSIAKQRAEMNFSIQGISQQFANTKKQQKATKSPKTVKTDNVNPEDKKGPGKKDFMKQINKDETTNPNNSQPAMTPQK